MPLCVFSAFFRARFGRGCTGFQNGFDHGGVGSDLSGQDRAGGGTDICAVQIRADARGQFGHHLLGQARVGTGGAGLSVGKARCDAFDVLFLVRVVHVVRVGFEHRVDVFQDFTPVLLIEKRKAWQNLALLAAS
ncbi:hypothetical protein ACTXOR_10595 [Arthrobacter rhombi]|uniref:hypothetical protein n=1 Tax=Arthrobacter rhombi TaxID=71253 RepID=UPI003FD09C20